MRGNDIVVAGRVYPRGRDEEHIDLRYSASGNEFCTFNLSAWSHKDQQTDENVYISYQAVCFGEMAVNFVESIEPGDTVIVAGRLQANNWEDDEGKRRYDQSLICDEIGISLRWAGATPVRTDQTEGRKRSSSKPKARTDYGPDEAPF